MTVLPRQRILRTGGLLSTQLFHYILHLKLGIQLQFSFFFSVLLIFSFFLEWGGGEGVGGGEGKGFIEMKRYNRPCDELRPIVN